MGNYEIIEHTADVGIVATAANLTDAFALAAAGMFSVMVDPTGVIARETVHARVQSDGPETLLVDWLNELLYCFNTNGFVPCEYEISLADEQVTLIAECRGEKLDPERHVVRTDVKAATYHKLQVKKNGEWRIQVILDI